jgi:ABC-type glycerol-3-phosphate transport system substrate-binding protein
MKRILTSLLALIFVISMFAGCGASTDTAKSDTGAAETSAPADASTQSEGPKPTGKVNEFGWEIPEKTLEFSYYVGQDNPDTVAKNSKKMAQYLLDNFNVKLNKIVYDTDMIEKLNLMLASNDYPDVISNMAVTEAQKWVDLGKAQEMTPLIEKYGPNITKEMGDMLKRYRDEDGKIYILPVGWGLLPIADYGAQVRLDWYMELGSPQFSTTDEYFEVLKQLVAKHPKNAAGEKVYALGTWKDDKIIEQLSGVWGLKYGYKENADGSLTHWINTPEGLEFTKWYNKFNREGLLDPDSFTQKRDDWMAKCSNERYAGHFANWWVTKDAGNMTWVKTKPDFNDNMRYTHYSIKAPTAEKSYLNPKNTMGWGRTIITDKCANPEEVMKWFNFEQSSMGMKLLSWGIPNTDTSVWNIDKTGKWEWVKKETDKLLDGTFVWPPFDENGGVSFWLVMGQKFYDDGTECWFDQNFVSKWFKFKDDNLKDTIYDFSAFYAIPLPSDSNITVINQQIKDLTLAGFANAVMAKTEADCVARYNEMKEKVVKAGVAELEKYYSENYKKNLEAWK